MRINEDQLNSFLHTAKSLGIRGLMGDGKKVDIENDKKRKRRHSVELSSDQEEEEEENSLTASSPPPPPPPLLKHKTSLTKPQNLEVKCELPMNQESRFESAMNTMQPETESLTQNSSINSGQELEDDELDLFQHCGVNNVNNHHNNHLHHPGPSRLSAEELHSSGQGKSKNKIIYLFSQERDIGSAKLWQSLSVTPIRELELADQFNVVLRQNLNAHSVGNVLGLSITWSNTFPEH